MSFTHKNAGETLSHTEYNALVDAVDGITQDTTITKSGNTFNGNSQLVKTDVDGKLPAVDGSALTNLPAPDLSAYSTTTQVDTKDAAVISTIKGGVSTSGDTLSKLYNLITAIQTLLTSNDVNFDTLQEVVNGIKSDEGLITSLTTNKVNISDVVNVLTTTTSGKVLDARAAKTLNDLIASLQSTVDANTSNVTAIVNSRKANADSSFATGLDPTGATDSTAAVIAAAVAAGSTSTTPTVRLPAGTFKLNLTGLDRIYLEGVSSDLTTIIPASSTSPIISAGGTGDLADQRSYINKVRITTGGADRSYIYPLIKFSFSRNVVFGDDVFFDVAGNTALCIQFIAAFQIHMNGVQFRSGKWALPVEFKNDVTHPTSGLYQQCDTNYFKMQVDGCFGAIFRTANNESHGHNFWIKVWQSTYYSPAPSENTTLNGAHSAGATTLTLTSATGIVAGDTLHIDCGLDACEIVRVTSVSGNTVTLHSSTPLLFNHLTLAEVFRGGIVASFADQYNNVKFHEFHAEGQQLGIACGNMYGVHFNAPYKGCGRLVHMSKDVKNLRVIAPEMVGTINLNELCRHSSNYSGAGSDGPWYCEDPIVPTGTSITPTIPGSYFPHNTKPWRLISNAGGGAASTERFNVNSGSNISTKRFMGFANGVEKSNITYASGSAMRTRNSTATDYTILSTDSEYIAVTDTSAARTITLPAANAVVPGKTYTIKDESGAAATNNITVTRAGTDLFEGGASTKVINTNYGTVKVYSDGSTRWFLA